MKTILQMQKHVWLELKKNPHFTKCPTTKHLSKWKDFKNSCSYGWCIEDGVNGCEDWFLECIRIWLEEVENAEWKARQEIEDAEWEAEHNVS